MKIKRLNWAIFFLLTVALTLVSCNRKTIYTHYQTIGSEGWLQEDTLFFTPPLVSKTGTCHVAIGVRTNTDYPFTTLTVVVEQSTTLSHQQKTDTIVLRLVDDDGNAMGEGVAWKSLNYSLGSLSLVEDDSLCFRIHHFMRRKLLHGITDVGVTLSR